MTKGKVNKPERKDRDDFSLISIVYEMLALEESFLKI